MLYEEALIGLRKRLELVNNAIQSAEAFRDELQRHRANTAFGYGPGNSVSPDSKCSE